MTGMGGRMDVAGLDDGWVAGWTGGWRLDGWVD